MSRCPSMYDFRRIESIAVAAVGAAEGGNLSLALDALRQLAYEAERSRDELADHLTVEKLRTFKRVSE